MASATKVEEIEHFMLSNDIKITAIQETKFSKQNNDPKFIKFAIVRRDRKTGKGGELIFLIDKQIPFQHADIPEDPQDPMEVQAITIQAEARIINIINIYIYPTRQQLCYGIHAVYKKRSSKLQTQ